MFLIFYIIWTWNMCFWGISSHEGSLANIYRQANPIQSRQCFDLFCINYNMTNLFICLIPFISIILSYRPFSFRLLAIVLRYAYMLNYWCDFDPSLISVVLYYSKPTHYFPNNIKLLSVNVYSFLCVNKLINYYI